MTKIIFITILKYYLTDANKYKTNATIASVSQVFSTFVRPLFRPFLGRGREGGGGEGVVGRRKLMRTQCETIKVSEFKQRQTSNKYGKQNTCVVFLCVLM